MRWLITAALFLLMLTAQSIAAPRISALLDGSPDLVIILVVQLALLAPGLDGVIWAWAMGLLSDLHNGHPAGILALTCALVALGCHRIRRNVFAAHILTRLILVLVADFLQHLTLMFAGIIRGHPVHFLLFWRRALLSVVYTAVVAVVLLPILSLILKPLYRQPGSR